MKHTPGPWTIQHSTINNVEHHINIVQYSVPIKDQPEEHRANARLIAAAPDLLECCKRALADSARVHPDFMQQLKQAINKAIK